MIQFNEEKILKYGYVYCTDRTQIYNFIHWAKSKGYFKQYDNIETLVNSCSMWIDHNNKGVFIGLEYSSFAMGYIPRVFVSYNNVVINNDDHHQDKPICNKPNRDISINKDDILNLTILLNSKIDFTTFLDKV